MHPLATNPGRGVIFSSVYSLVVRDYRYMMLNTFVEYRTLECIAAWVPNSRTVHTFPWTYKSQKQVCSC